MGGWLASVFLLNYYGNVFMDWNDLLHKGFQSIGEKSRDYIAAAKVIGAGPMRIIFKHLLPNVISTLVTFSHRLP